MNGCKDMIEKVKISLEVSFKDQLNVASVWRSNCLKP